MGKYNPLGAKGMVPEIYVEGYVTGGGLTTISSIGDIHPWFDAATALGETSGDFTLSAGTSGTLDNAAAADNGDGTVDIPITGHDFIAGDIISIINTTNYDGVYVINSVAANYIVITSAYVAETFAGTEVYIRPDSFHTNVSAAGVYQFILTFSATMGAGASSLWEFGIYVGTTLKHKIKRQIPGVDTGAAAVSGITELVAGDHIWFGITNTTTTNDITIGEASMNLHMI